ncbi:MAG: LptA/OstA family protein [Pseudomonadota bacterium]
MRRPFLFLLLLSLIPTAATAQGTRISFGTEAHDSTQRIEVTSDQLDLDQAAGTAIFTGDVRAAQGALRIAADEITVFYAEDAAGAQGQISRLEARGAVTVTNGLEAAESETASYDVATGIVVMEGDVLLTQGTSAVSSETLRIDLTTGEGTFGGRVRTVFDPEASQ